MASRAQLSLATAQPSSSSPMHSGRKPRGSRAAMSLRGRHDREGVSALEAVHGGTYGLLDGAGAQPLARYDVADDLAVRGAGEYGAVELQLGAQLAGVGEVAVVRQGHAALDVADDYGLGVLAGASAGGAVAAVADGHLAGGQLAHDVLGEHLVDQADVLVAGDDAVVVDGDAAALLAAVLQRVERAVGHGHDVLARAGNDAEHAALLVQLVKDKVSLHVYHSPIMRRITS